MIIKKEIVMLNFLKKNLEELKSFALRGNVLDMAIGIIIGASFSKIVNSMVEDIIMPPLGWLMGKVDFSNLYLSLPDASGKINIYPSLESAKAAGAVTINYGIFINTIISFCLVVLSVFVLIKFINRIKASVQKETAKEEESTTKTCPRCLSVINIKATRCPFCTSDVE